jgi:predicted DNA-binding protein
MKEKTSVSFTFYMPRELAERLREYAHQKRKSKGSLVREGIEKILKTK